MISQGRQRKLPGQCVPKHIKRKGTKGGGECVYGKQCQKTSDETCQLLLFVLGAYHPHAIWFGNRFNDSLIIPAAHDVSRCEQLYNLLLHMSCDHPQTTVSSSSNFQQIFNDALKAYTKRTKTDLLLHPLAAQLQACGSSGAILSVLRKQVEELNRSRNTDHRWTKWLEPTVNVLFSFSATIGEGVGLVCLRI